MDIESILAGKGREVRTIMPDATIAEAVDRMRKEWIGAVVVSEDGARIAGIISDRGIMNAIADHGVEVINERVHRVMTKEVFTCVPRDRVSAIMAAMTIRRIRHIPVVEKNGRLCGIVSIGDVVKHNWTRSSAKRMQCGNTSAALGDGAFDVRRTGASGELLRKHFRPPETPRISAARPSRQRSPDSNIRATL